MDTLTHALSGALVARATERADPTLRPLPRTTRLWVGFWAAAFPDSDFALRFIDPLLYLTTHRGITHSVLLLPVWAMGLALIFFFLTRRRYSWRALAFVSALGIAAHIAGDIITAFGTMVLAPVSSVRVAWPTTFIIDPYFTAIIVGALVAATIWRATRLPAIVGLSVLVGYVAFQGWLHARAVDVGARYAETATLSGRIHALPQPFSPFHWLVVVEQPTRYHLAYIDFWRRAPALPPADDAAWLVRHFAAYLPPTHARWVAIERFGDTAQTIPLARAAWESDVLAAYRQFAMLPALYATEADGARVCVWFQDLRFALVGRDMPFRYGACRDAAAWRAYRYGDAPPLPHG